ncbi:hypothetical protein M427DRAFT_356283 [Gonapodya prolifera JEL478]|uniref:Uncharacterized protein n=1 Tax=Gonapodya prolifera (strain JEL478) TaxID=1344416 RepID=A0A139AAY5_GONPJ|nr:hypothetical protein M427DRAFT_356283 [Gonapodya prolifera JEL478]|eukprot:KXS13966.1 hypothetical protein M427DRAFT_356283 [Gonapodya prolifera JEL478]
MSRLSRYRIMTESEDVSLERLDRTNAIPGISSSKKPVSACDQAGISLSSLGPRHISLRSIASSMSRNSTGALSSSGQAQTVSASPSSAKADDTEKDPPRQGINLALRTAILIQVIFKWVSSIISWVESETHFVHQRSGRRRCPDGDRLSQYAIVE